MANNKGRGKKRRISGRDARRFERIVKGFSNHWRIRILALLAQEPELSVDEIARRLNGNFKTVSVHIRQMAQTGLLLKRYEGRAVRHKLTNRGKSILTFLGKLE